ncbi:hypothetical protein OC835_007346 [Tilletia horrida]|nr:hypothetical protein OC835_007346 [Tilletia horrida]KAK0548925.1 hypothetical protein OC844_006946 [Tilletia horrida]
MPSAAAGSSGRRSSSRLQSQSQAPVTPARTRTARAPPQNGKAAKAQAGQEDLAGAADGGANEDTGIDSEESEIDLSPLPAERRASVIARLSASPVKLNGVDSPFAEGRQDTVPPLDLEDGDGDGLAAPIRASIVRGTDGEDSEEEEDDDDGPPVEESMTQARSKALETRQKQADARKEQTLKRKRAAESRSAVNAASKAQARGSLVQTESTEDDERDGDETAEDSNDDLSPAVKVKGMESSNGADDNPAPSKKGRLDPALFAAAFAPKSEATSSASEGQFTRLNAAQQKRQTRGSASKGKGLLKGRDGLPMTKLKDGRTTVRSLQSKPRRSDESQSRSNDAPDEDAEAVERPDANLSMPTAKARAFSKKVLGLRASDVAASANGGKKQKGKAKDKTKPKRTDDDPLGLEDPLFMNLDGKSKKGKKRESTLTGRRARGSERGSSGAASSSRSGRRGEGGRQAVSSSALGGRSSGPALLFRRT